MSLRIFATVGGLVQEGFPELDTVEALAERINMSLCQVHMFAESVVPPSDSNHVESYDYQLLSSEYYDASSDREDAETAEGFATRMFHAAREAADEEENRAAWNQGLRDGASAIEQSSPEA